MKNNRIEKFTKECLDYIHDYACERLCSYEYYEAVDGKVLSPIEKLFVMAFELLKMTEQIESEMEYHYSTEVVCSNNKKYYPDFTFSFNDINHLNLLIELDGHIWHEKTPEQVEKDKQRERDLIKDGYTILRYSGREVWKNPVGIIEEVHSEYWKRIDKELNRRRNA